MDINEDFSGAFASPAKPKKPAAPPRPKPPKPSYSAPDLNAAPPWASIEAKPEFAALSAADKAAAKEAYFDYWIAPHAGADADALRGEFLAPPAPAAPAAAPAAQVAAPAAQVSPTTRRAAAAPGAPAAPAEAEQPGSSIGQKFTKVVGGMLDAVADPIFRVANPQMAPLISPEEAAARDKQFPNRASEPVVPGVQRSLMPVSPALRRVMEAQYNAATPEERLAMARPPEEGANFNQRALASIARELNDRYGLRDKAAESPVTPPSLTAARQQIDPRGKPIDTGSNEYLQPKADPGSAAGTARNLGAGLLKIPQTTVKGVADITQMLTGGQVGGDLSAAMRRGMQATDSFVGTQEFNRQKQGFEQVMLDDTKGIGDMFAYLIENPAVLVDESITTIGSMFLPVAAAGAASKISKAAKLSDSARRKAVSATTLGTIAAQNAADTFTSTADQPLDQRYQGAATAAAISLLFGIVTKGGAEGVIARRMIDDLQAGRIGLSRVKDFFKAVGNEALQEAGEEAGGVLGESVASRTPPNMTNAGKRVTYAGTLGGVMGGGINLLTGGEAARQPPPGAPGAQPPPAAQAPSSPSPAPAQPPQGPQAGPAAPGATQAAPEPQAPPAAPTSAQARPSDELVNYAQRRLETLIDKSEGGYTTVTDANGDLTEEEIPGQELTDSEKREFVALQSALNDNKWDDLQRIYGPLVDGVLSKRDPDQTTPATQETVDGTQAPEAQQAASEGQEPGAREEEVGQEPKSPIDELGALQKRAEEGDIEAAFELAVLYDPDIESEEPSSIKVSKNPLEALRLYRLASDKGHLDAKYNLALTLFDEKSSKTEATKLLRELASNGFQDAIDFLKANEIDVVDYIEAAAAKGAALFGAGQQNDQQSAPQQGQKQPSQGIVGEEAPEAIASMRAALENPSTPVFDGKGYQPPPWEELPNGFAARQYIVEKDGKRTVVQEIRAPKADGKDPAVIRRGLDSNGTPFGEMEASGTLDDIFSGVAFSDFNEFFASKSRSALPPPADPTPPTEPPRTERELMEQRRKTTLITSDEKLDAEWDVVDADEVKASMREGVNQPRDRQRAASNLQVMQISKNPDFELLSDTSKTMDYGSPTITKDGIIVGGNGRFEGVSIAYDSGTAAEYRKQLEENAARLGLDPAKIRGMKKPVLVRRISQDADTRRLAIQSNQAAGLQMSDMEQAAVDAERMKSLDRIQVDDSGNISMNANNIQVIKEALKDYTTNEQAGFIAADGSLAQSGIRRIRNAILFQAYGKSETLARLIESPNSDLKNVGTALVRAAAQLANTRRLQDYDISADITEAVETLSQLRTQGRSIEDFLSQIGMFGDSISAEAREILQFLNDNIRSARAITEFLQEYAATVETTDNPSGDIFGDAPRPSKLSTLQQLRGKSNAEKQQAGKQGDIFGQPTKPPVDTAPPADERPGETGQEGGQQPEGQGSDARDDQAPEGEGGGEEELASNKKLRKDAVSVLSQAFAPDENGEPIGSLEVFETKGGAYIASYTVRYGSAYGPGIYRTNFVRNGDTTESEEFDDLNDRRYQEFGTANDAARHAAMMLRSRADIQTSSASSKKDKENFENLSKWADKKVGQDPSNKGQAQDESSESEQVGASPEETREIAEAFDEAERELSNGKAPHRLFDRPLSKTRIQDAVKVYAAESGWMTLDQAKEQIRAWEKHAVAQAGKNPANGNKVVLSLFDRTGAWSLPWEQAGYQVYRFDIQNDPEVGDVNNFSAEFFNDWFSSFEGMDVYAILAACPCTDFASSGARHFAAKDESGATVRSVELVRQTLATIEHFAPAVWAIENPVGRIEKLTGLPPWRMSFDPNHFGDPYTKKTLLWGRFNANLPVAPVEPTEGSKMHSQYGGSSIETKNARSVTPEGFAYSFFMANNAIDNPAIALSGKYDRLDADLMREAADAGITVDDLASSDVDDAYYSEMDDKAAEDIIRNMTAARKSAADVNDIDKMLDDLLNEELEDSESTPPLPPPEPRSERAPRPPRAPRSSGGKGGKSAPRTERSAREAAASAAKNTAKGASSAIDALGKLFGGDGKLGSGLSFDEETYAKAKPAFIQAVKDFGAAIKDLRDVGRAVVQSVRRKYGSVIADRMKPYMARFLADVRDGKINLRDTYEPPRGNDTQSDRQDDSDEESDDETTVPNEPGRNQRRPRRSGGGAGGGRSRSPRGERVPGSGAASSGERGDQPVHQQDGRFDVEGGSAGGADQEGSGQSGRPGDDAQRGAEEGTVRAPSLTKAERLAAQAAAEDVEVKLGDEQNIRDTLPLLFDTQHQDVLFAENRLQRPDGYGVLFANGTGTGKTFLGLGIVKRMVKSGKPNGLIVVPNDAVMNEWTRSAEKVNLEINKLESTSDKGRGVAITTYANLANNLTLADREIDFFVADEAHNLMANQDAAVTSALEIARAITLHPEGARKRSKMKERVSVAQFDQIVEDLKKIEKILPKTESDAISLKQRKEKLNAEYLDLAKKLAQAFVREEDYINARQGSARPRAVFLSATPFAYEKNTEWAQGYLFEYPKPISQTKGYNDPSPRDRFMMQHFGYRMRYNKLTEPDFAVNRDVMQRQFNTWLRSEGVLSTRLLEVDRDYDRKFILIDGGIGTRIDQAMTWLRETKNGLYSIFYKTVVDNFDYLARSRLLEAIKSNAAIDYIKKHHALGRKVIVFYDYNQGGGFNPFSFDVKRGQVIEVNVRNPITNEYDNVLLNVSEFLDDLEAEFGDLMATDFGAMKSPLETLTAAFPTASVYNGIVNKNTRQQTIDDFNNDTKPEANLLIVQSSANAGWSGHDTTGEFQRVLINLGLPVAPTKAIQQEGRIYRVGQESDAIFRYFNTGTNWERTAFATKVARRASAAENMAMGEQARALLESFVDAFESSEELEPNAEEGMGGKARDRNAANALTPMERAKSFYFGRGKKTASNKAREGKDYFATPEPIGLMMVEWLHTMPNDLLLEPSAGHGAIARWFPEYASRRVIEPSLELAGQLGLVTDADQVNEDFEQHNIVNKYNGIAMNPPFGVGGKTAIEHLEKAFGHLSDGGRVVAIIPEGPAADKRFEDWLYGQDEKGRSKVPNARLAASISLPTVTFERAATKAKTRIVVIDRVEDKNAPGVESRNIDLSGYDDINELFEAISRIDIRRVRPDPEKAATAAQEAGAPPVSVPEALGDNQQFRVVEAPESLSGYKIVTDLPEIEHTTKKGYKLVGVIIKDGVAAKKVDDRTFLKREEGGYFVRKSYIVRPDRSAKPQVLNNIRRRPSIDAQLKKSGVSVNDYMDAIRRWNAGERLFGFPEMDEAPVEINSVEMLGNYNPEQLMALPGSERASSGLEEADKFLDANDLKGFEQTYDYMRDDRSHGDEFLVMAAEIMQPPRGVKVDLRKWTADVLRLSQRMNIESDGDPAEVDIDFYRARRGDETVQNINKVPRTPELQEAAKRLQAGEITAAEYGALVDRYRPVRPYDYVPEPASDADMRRALSSDKVDRINAPASLPEGTKVGLRLDIPAYNRHGVWVVSVHEQRKKDFAAGRPIGYQSTAAATNVTFGAVEKAALNIAAGSAKGTIAVMKGDWKPASPEQAKEMAEAALNDPAWRQIGVDPERHSYFYDRATMQPIVAADEVIQIGPLVLGKNVKYADPSEFLFSLSQPSAPAFDKVPDAVRADALPKLKSLEARLEAGKITEAEYRLGVQQVIARLETRNVVREARAAKDRRRGPEWIIAQFERQAADGTIPRDEADFVRWLIEQNPAIADDLAVSFKQGSADSVAGNYHPVLRLITIFKSAMADEANIGTGTHEILHHSERMMPGEVQDGILAEWKKAWIAELKKANKEQRGLLFDMLAAGIAGAESSHRRVVAAFNNGILDYNAHYQLYSPSEFWAVNGTRILNDRRMAQQSWVKRARQWLKEMIERAKSLFGLRSDAAVIRGLDAVLKGEGRTADSVGLLANRAAVGTAFFRGMADEAAVVIDGAEDTGARTFNNIARRTRNNAVQFWGNRNEKVKTFNWYDRKLAQQYHKALKDADFGKVFATTTSILNTVSLTAIRAAELAPGILTRVEDVKQSLGVLFGPGQSRKNLEVAADALFAGTLAGEGAYDGKIWSKGQFMSKFKGANEASWALYQQGRAAIDASLNELAAAEAYSVVQDMLPASARQEILDDVKRAHAVVFGAVDKEEKRAKRMADEAKARGDGEAEQRHLAELSEAQDARKKVEKIFGIAKSLKDGGYAPLMRFGRFGVTVTRIDPVSGRPDPGDDGDSILHFSRYESENDARAALRELRAAYGTGKDVQIVAAPVSEKSNQLYAGISPETMSVFAEAIGADAAMKKYIEQVASERSALKRRLDRSGTPGYSRELPRVLSNFITSNARYASQRYFLKELDRNISRIPKKTKGDVLDEAILLKNFVLSPDDAGAKISSVMFIMFLTGSVAAAFLNTTQTLTATVPYLSQYAGARGAAAQSFKTAMSIALGKMKPDPVLEKALKRANQEGIVDAQEIFHLYSVGAQGVASGLINTLAKIPGAGRAFKDGGAGARARANAALTLLGSMFSLAEKFNRKVAFVSAYEVARKNGSSDDIAYAFAVRTVNETQGVFNKAGRSNWARPTIGRALLTFKTFSLMYMEMFARMVKHGGPAGKKAAVMMLAILMLLAGEEGLPFMQDLNDLIDTLGQFLGYDTNTVRFKRRWAHETLGQGFGDFALYGVSSLLPLDWHGRLGLGNLIPGTGLFKLSNKENRARDVAEIIGPTAGAAQQIADAWDAAGDGKYGKAFQSAVPKFARDILQGIEMGRKGYATDARGRFLADTDGLDAAVKMIGFQPTKVAKRQRAASPMYQDIALQKREESAIIDEMASALVAGDVKAEDAALKRYDDWNRKNPDTPIVITPKQIEDRVKSMRAGRDAALLKSAPRELRDRVADGLDAVK